MSIIPEAVVVALEDQLGLARLVLSFAFGLVVAVRG